LREASGPALPLLELLDPQIDFAFGLFLGVAVARLKKAEQFGAFAVDDINIVISQLAPLRPDLALELLSVSFDFIPVHDSLLLPGFGYFDASRAYRVRPAIADSMPPAWR